MAGSSRFKRWVATGVAASVVAVWGGFTVAEAAAPSKITTCTKNSNNKTKVIAAGAASTAKCTKNGKGVAQTWVPQSQLTTAQRFVGVLRGSADCGGPTNNFRGMNFSGMRLPPCLIGGDFRGANLSNAFMHFTHMGLGNFNGANLTNAHFEEADLTNAINGSGAVITGSLWINTICPDGTNSDSHGLTCDGHGF